MRLDDLRAITSSPNAAAEPEELPTGQPVFSSEELFGNATEIGITHQGLVYRLRITRQGKLVLNK